MSITTYFQSLNHKKGQGLLLFLFILSTLIYFRFDNIIHNLGTQKVLEAWGDGVKTYTNSIYHIDYDAENNWFGGMNYPYGEHIIPTTELPGLSMTMKPLKGIFPNISDYVVPLIHLEMLLAFWLSGLFLFLLFRELKLPFWYSSLVAIGLTFLSPLYPRIDCHFGLAQPFIIPLILYLLLLFEKKPSYKISIVIGLSVFISSFLHFYFFGIIVFIISFYFFFRLFSQPKNSVSADAPFWQKIIQSAPVNYAIRMIPHYFLMLITTLLFFYFWMISQDPVLDRSPNPYGFLIYISNWEGVFLWEGNPLLNSIKKHFSETEFEGKSYIGMVAILFIIAALLGWVKSGFKRFFITQSDKVNVFFKASLGASIVLLILAMGYPFILAPLEFLVDYAGPLKQFRSMGRFAWVFFYVINIIAFYTLYFYLKKQSKPLKIGGFLFIFALIFGEAYVFTMQIHFNLHEVPHWQAGTKFSDLENIDFNQYQATVPIPFYSLGSNNFDAQQGGGFTAQRTQTISAQTGLPTTGAMLTRSSMSQTFNQWQMLLEPYRMPIIFQDFKNKKPLLLVWFNNSKEDYLPLYGHLQKGAKSIYKGGEMELFHTELSDFEDRITSKKQKIKAVLEQDSLFEINGFQSTDSVENFVFRDFAEIRVAKTYLDSGSFAGQLNVENELFAGSLPNVEKNALYHLQTWAWVYEDKMPYTKVSLIEEDAAGTVLQEQIFHLWPNIRTLDPNGWALVDYAFRPQAVDSRFRITFIGNEKRDERTQYFDELLIKPVTTHLYQETDGYIWKDNLWFEK